ncbi:MAG: ATP-binding cassette domain-containing protein, partial [Betaproteobacteria bacterium]|nr:ATP-binding cassette domain-containing protein [Betaproteobacteria bacterium]
MEVRDLTLVRGTRTLVDSLSFSLLPGQALILRGTNGSGKTSLLRVLAGLAVPDAGSINDRAGPDQPPTDQPPLAHPPIAPTAIGRLYLGHANALKDELTAEENLVTLLAFDGVEVDAPTLTQA